MPARAGSLTAERRDRTADEHEVVIRTVDRVHEAIGAELPEIDVLLRRRRSFSVVKRPVSEHGERRLRDAAVSRAMESDRMHPRGEVRALRGDVELERQNACATR